MAVRTYTSSMHYPFSICLGSRGRLGLGGVEDEKHLVTLSTLCGVQNCWQGHRSLSTRPLEIDFCCSFFWTFITINNTSPPTVEHPPPQNHRQARPPPDLTKSILALQDQVPRMEDFKTYNLTFAPLLYTSLYLGRVAIMCIGLRKSMRGSDATGTSSFI